LQAAPQARRGYELIFPRSVDPANQINDSRHFVFGNITWRVDGPDSLWRMQKLCESEFNRCLKRAAESPHKVKRPGITLSILQNKPQENKKYKKIQ
jgi:hypothetical protein